MRDHDRETHRMIFLNIRWDRRAKMWKFAYYCAGCRYKRYMWQKWWHPWNKIKVIDVPNAT